MEVIAIFAPYIYSIKYDGQDENEFDRLFEEWNDVNLEKLAEMAKPRSEKALEVTQRRKESREWLRMSQDIALCLHYYLRKMEMTQKDLSEKLGVSPTYVGNFSKARKI